MTCNIGPVLLYPSPTPHLDLQFENHKGYIIHHHTMIPEEQKNITYLFSTGVVLKIASLFQNFKKHLRDSVLYSLTYTVHRISFTIASSIQLVRKHAADFLSPSCCNTRKQTDKSTPGAPVWNWPHSSKWQMPSNWHATRSYWLCFNSTW